MRVFRMQSPHFSPINSTHRFSDRVEFYLRSRPKYPPALLKFCQGTLGLRSPHSIADIGSGTGFLSELFLDNGNDVYAVEPNANMRQAAETLFADRRNFHSMDATAEATGLADASVDFIVAGQAFHWFDRPRARAEFTRILRSGGWVVLVWNDRRVEAGFSTDYEQIVLEFETDLKHVSHQQMTATDSDILAQFFAPASYATASFDNPQSLDLDGVLARAMSSSYLPAPGHPRCEEMLNRLKQIYDRHQIAGQVVQPYDTRVYYARLITHV
jgi:SAM-dependent methyltransferase